MLRWRFVLLVGLLFALSVTTFQHPGITQAQGGDSCETVVQAAYDALAETCAGLARNEACIASMPVQAFDTNNTPIALEAGTVFQLASLQEVSAGPLDVENGTYGAARLREGAGLPQNSREFLTMWLLGGVQLIDTRSDEQRTADPAATCYATVTTETLNVRNFPASNGFVMDSLQAGDRMIITGRLADASWWRIDYPDPERTAWVFSGFTRTDCPIIEIPTVLRNAPPFSAAEWYRDPFQSAALVALPAGDEADEAATTCRFAPPAGLLLQPPESGQARFTLNGVEFDLHATMYVQSDPETGLLFQALDNTVPFNLSDGTVLEIPAGSQLRFALEADGVTAAPMPLRLEPLTVQDVWRLPLDRLPRPTQLAQAVTELPVQETTFTGDLTPEEPASFFFDNRAGVVYDISLSSDAFPLLSIYAPDVPVLRPYIPQGQVSFSYWPTSNRPHYLELESGIAASGTYTLTSSAQDLRLCRDGGNSQSRTLPGGEDHAGNIWFGQAGDVVTITASGDISESASAIRNWRLRIHELFLEYPTAPPILYNLLAGHNANTITWTVPETGYYRIEVWTAASGTTTVSTTCE